MQIYVKPKAGLKIMNPVTKRAISAEGEMVVSSSYWSRRISDGDIEVIEQKSAASAELKKSKGDL
jgi:hypothetical protein